jgi:hypothetical protein
MGLSRMCSDEARRLGNPVIIRNHSDSEGLTAYHGRMMARTLQKAIRRTAAQANLAPTCHQA